MASQERVRVGVIGVGQIGKHHLDNYKKIPDAEVVAIADVNAAEAERVGGLYGVPNVYTDFRQLLARDDIQAVDVCVHNNYHMPISVAAFEAGKDVFCEKPMAGAYVDARRMWETAQATGRKFAIQFVTMFANETKAARLLIEGGQDNTFAQNDFGVSVAMNSHFALKAGWQARYNSDVAPTKRKTDTLTTMNVVYSFK